jgi:hypothetical protein
LAALGDWAANFDGPPFSCENEPEEAQEPSQRRAKATNGSAGGSDTAPAKRAPTYDCRGGYVGGRILEHSRQADITPTSKTDLGWRGTMRPPKALCWLVLITMAPQLTGCYTATTVSPQSLRGYPDTADQSRVLKVTIRGGASVNLRGVWADSVTVYGTPANVDQNELAGLQIPLEDVTKIEALRFSIGKTALLVVGVAVTLVGSVLAIAMRDFKVTLGH